MSTKTVIDQLPSLPQALLQILDAILSDQADFQRIANIIRQDPAITTRLLEIANSSFYSHTSSCSTIERALMLLGTDTVKTLVITTATKQFFKQFDQSSTQFLHSFWRRSLIAANFAQVLATLTSYSAPDEAYLCGLLTDVGQLMLLTEHKDRYQQLLNKSSNDTALLDAERTQLCTTHCESGAILVDSWSLDGFMSDALRYHHEDSSQVQDAHQLVKIINLASLVSAEGDIDDKALQASYELFGLNESLTRELHSRINKDVANIAQSFGIDLEQPNDEHHMQARQQLGQRLSELSELDHLNHQFGQQVPHNKAPRTAHNTIRRAAFLSLGVQHSLLFTLHPERKQLSAWVDNSNTDPDNSDPDFNISIHAGRSAIADAFLSAKIVETSDIETLSVIDRQLLHHTCSEQLYCLPLTHQNQTIAVLACGLSHHQCLELESRRPLIHTFTQQAAASLFQTQQQGDKTLPQRVHEAVHEVSNPLSIIRNYLETLTIKLDDEETSKGLGLIKEEIDRVGDILLRLRDNKECSETETNTSDLNAIIKETAEIFQQSICLTHDIQLTLQLDPQLLSLHFNSSHLKQILTNLIKNACEALTNNGIITISTEASLSLSGRNFAAITVEDNGPGIPADIKQQLFSPIESTKGAKHSGLGLSIVNKLIEEMNGSIVCRSNTTSGHGKTGTQFQILLPK